MFNCHSYYGNSDNVIINSLNGNPIPKPLPLIYIFLTSVGLIFPTYGDIGTILPYAVNILHEFYPNDFNWYVLFIILLDRMGSNKSGTILGSYDTY